MATISLFAQSNISEPMSFHIEKDPQNVWLTIDESSISFVDPDNNNAIDANETFTIRFAVVNKGRDDGHGCVARITISGDTKGITVRDISIPVIPHGGKQWVEVPIKANESVKTGEISYTIYVNEPENNNNTRSISGVIGTHKLRTPLVEVTSHHLGNNGGVLKRLENFKLQFIVQNTDQGVAENVTVKLENTPNITWMGGSERHINIGTLKPNESKTLEYVLAANQDAAESVNIHITLSERTGKYAKSADIPLQFGQYVGSSIAMNVERKDAEVEIQKASLISDVDENIPVTNAKNTNTFVLIIANEHYQHIDPVPFAHNDGKIFREYCIKTLGINKDNIQYVADAQYSQMNSEIKWLIKKVKKYETEKPQVIVYYAGHGIPDNNTKSAYLLPVEGSGTDVGEGFKLEELYDKLGDLSASQITIFIDACFSGTNREGGFLTSARGVAYADSGLPHGNMVVFSAAKGNETAFPYKEKYHGLFTYFLLKKLQETEGNVNLKSLGDYICTEVGRQAVKEKKDQTPCITPSETIGPDWQNWKLK